MMEVTLMGTRYTGQMTCREALDKMQALGFRLATCREAQGYTALPLGPDGPVLWEGGNATCESTNYGTQDGDAILVNERLIGSNDEGKLT